MAGSEFDRLTVVDSREELQVAVVACAEQVVRSDGVRLARLDLTPRLAYRVLAQTPTAPDPSPRMTATPIASPLIEHYIRNRVTGWISMADLLGRAWLEHPLYRDVYRPLGLRSQISGAIWDGGGHMYALSLNRQGRDFSSRERESLRQLKTLAAVAWKHVHSLNLVRAAQRAVADPDDTRLVLVLAAGRGGTLHLVEANPGAADALRSYPELVALAASVPTEGPWSGQVRTHDGTCFTLSVLPRPEGRIAVFRAVPALGLTPRETDVLRLLATGLTAHAVGRQLGIREATVRKHLERAYAKLGSHDRLGAVQLARQNGLLDRLQPA